MTGSKSRIVLIPYSTAYEEGFEDMVRRVPDITKLNQLIGYEPTVSLEERWKASLKISGLVCASTVC